MIARILPLVFLVAVVAPIRAEGLVVLVVTADAGDYLLSAGGTIAGMIGQGAVVHVIRAGNDEKDSYNLPPEETARRTRTESEEAGRILGVKDVISLGYRSDELGAVSFTELRDRVIFYIRLYKPRVLFIPNPYNEYDRVLDRYHTGWAAEDAWRSAAFANFGIPFAEAGLAPHLTPEIYYYGQPFDPRRREAESTAMFVPEIKIVDISATLDRKIKAAQALRTINASMAHRLKDRLTETHRRLRALDTLNDDAVNRLVEENVRGLGAIGARGTAYRAAEEFHYAGLEYQIPSKYLH